jgi:hypothetical protein
MLSGALYHHYLISASRVAAAKARCRLQLRQKSTAVLLLLVLLLAGSGCSFLQNYPRNFRPARFSVENGNPEQAVRYLQPKTGTRLDRLCYLLEIGTLFHAMGMWQESIETFGDAENVMEQAEQKAVISVSDIGSQFGSLLVNEKVIPYQGESFEKILLHTYQALNYYMTGRLDDSRVEIRQAYAVQQEEQEKHSKDLRELEQAAQTENLDTDTIWKTVLDHYEDQAAIAARTANVYQNAFTYYLSALVYKANKEPNDAYIDLKTVHLLRPDFPYAHPQLIELAMASGLWEDVPTWERKFDLSRNDIPRSGSELVVIYTCGWAPEKEEIKIAIPIPYERNIYLVPIAFPKYRVLESPIDHLEVLDKRGFLGATALLFDTEAAAVRYLRDKILRLAIKQALRAAIKIAEQKYAYDQAGMAASLAVGVANYLIEQADLRSWLSLPKNIQVAHFYLPSGDHDFTLQFVSPQGTVLFQDNVTVTLRREKIHVLLIRTFGTQHFVHYY